MHTSIELKRQVDAIQIPSGDMVTLPVGLKVIITQSLGGTYTVATDFGLARIQSKDADALGIDTEAEQKKAEADSSSNVPTEATDLEMEVWNQLRNVYDPEIPVNIYELGLIYEVKIAEPKDNGDCDVSVKMTLTSPGCPVAQEMPLWIQGAIMPIPGVGDVDVEVIWEPMWNPSMMAETAKMQLNLFY